MMAVNRSDDHFKRRPYFLWKEALAVAFLILAVFVAIARFWSHIITEIPKELPEVFVVQAALSNSSALKTINELVSRDMSTDFDINQISQHAEKSAAGEKEDELFGKFRGSGRDARAKANAWEELAKQANATKTCYVQESYSTRTSTSCYLVGRCRRSVTKYRSKAVCCDGWTGSTADGCPTPLCAGKHGAAACTLNEGRTELRSGQVYTSSGGTCTNPDVCENCNPGYYADGPYCRACTAISNCLYPQCTAAGNSRCQYCEGEIKSEYGYYAYSRFTDGGVSCKLACSWRTGSRCYPGSCPQTTVSSCSCSTGFSGTDCKQITAYPDVLQNYVGLSHVTETSSEVLEAPPDSGVGFPQETTWTNYLLFRTANAHVEASYKIDLPTPPNYVNADSTRVGIIQGQLKLQLDRTDSSSGILLSKTCPSPTPQPSNFRCEEEFDLTQLNLPFVHGDIITFSASATNGGYVTVYNRDVGDQNQQYNFIGHEQTNSFEIRFDTVVPYHCIETTDTCMFKPLQIPDNTTQQSFTITWDGWSDDLSGVNSYSIEVFRLQPTGSSEDSLLRYGSKVNGATTETVDSNTKSATVYISDPGPYVILMTSVDKAGNRRTTRRAMIFDDQSVVEPQGSNDVTDDGTGRCIWLRQPSSLVVETADPGTDCRWITSFTDEVTVRWQDHFINKRHHSGLWLNEIETDAIVDSILDDNEGNRQIARKDNILGLTRFEVAYTVLYEGTSNFSDFQPIENLFSESSSIQEEMHDGKRLHIRVRGYDITDAYYEDTVNVTADASTPIIENLWLTRGDKVNISVHNVQELEKLTIEWLSYDYHSGIYSMFWRIYDDFDGENITHGLAYISPQGNVNTEDECKSTYENYPGGHQCYCTPFDGCFHSHFQVKPRIVWGGDDGLHPDRDQGVHDSDYFLEIIATNKAKLQTKHTLKITIDISPPVEGIVMDGSLDEKDVDFQQDKILKAHWSDFFDKESGIMFYRYGFANDCIASDVFDIELLNNTMLNETTATWARHEVDEEGTYFITVAAYNRALDHSVPVCSDGITIDSTVPSISNVYIAGLRTKPGYIKDSNGQLWMLHSDRTIQLLNDLGECGATARSVSDRAMSLLPQRKNKDGTVYARNVNCLALEERSAEQLSYYSLQNQIEISWNVSTGESGIYDFEVGLSSQESEIPDILDFASTSHHQHARIRHPNIKNGETFYILIKAVSRAGVSGIQSVGPIMIDSTKPVFDGDLTIHYETSQSDEGFLVVNWADDALYDDEDMWPLAIEVALGSSPSGVDVLPYSPLSAGGSCLSIDNPATCAAIATDSLPWAVHGHQEYYVSLKASNTAGLFSEITSAPYVHDIVPPSAGVVWDVDTTTTEVHDIEDIDYQTNTGQISVKWFGFKHSELPITFSVCLAEDDVVQDASCHDVGDKEEETISGLNLDYFKKYSFVIIATTDAGNVTVMSDGVYVLDVNNALSDVYVFDGLQCDNTLPPADLSHHETSPEQRCIQDIDYQSSVNMLHAYWDISDEMNGFVHDIKWWIEERAPVVDFWTEVTAEAHVSAHSTGISCKYDSQPGRMYRMKLQFCASSICFQPKHTDGVTMVPNPPVSGEIEINYDEDANKVTVLMDKFYDPDITDRAEAESAIHYYEWAFTDNSRSGSIVEEWKVVEDVTELGENQMSFSVQLNEKITSTTCWRLAVRGYSFAGLSTVISEDVQNCSNKATVKPALVIDAVGYSTDDTLDAVPISLDKHALWNEHDVDYTPHNNILSAVWPTLRYKTYSWAVLKQPFPDASLLYEGDQPELHDPCDSPDAISCGTTASEFINVNFNDSTLEEGRRYMICIHANATRNRYEFWEEDLPEIVTCSDGVTVDVSPPVRGEVWISEKGTAYQNSLSHLDICWERFVDAEELGGSVHSSGIAYYEVAIGLSPGGADIVPFTNVGVTNHHVFHGLNLQNGHSYFATVKGTDFVRRSTSETAGILTDNTPPQKTNRSIEIGSRHINTLGDVTACWTGLFVDAESGMNHYAWSVGSRPGYDDIKPYAKTDEECASSGPTQLPLEEGHAYYVSVQGFNGVGLWSKASSWAFTVDVSPPLVGTVHDGQNTEAVFDDIDYQSSRNDLYSKWKGFYDPHSAIKEYWISIGRCKGCDDVIQYQPLGIVNEIHVSNLHLVEGLTYYTTLTACNTADLCCSATSDGVTIDSTAPVPGRVLDGVSGNDIQFQASRNHTGAKWNGFVDPQSGIQFYEYKAGTTPGGDDVIPTLKMHKYKEAIIPNVFEKFDQLLPIGKIIYNTVTAVNKAGANSSATSNGFLIDDTPPVFTGPLTHVRIGSVFPSTSVYRCALKVSWLVEDQESYIENQYLSLTSHIGEDFNTSISIGGLLREHTFTELDLHDGSRYDVKLISCNGARLCSTSVVKDILVDNSPPVAGTFAINTQNAASIYRQPDGFMRWNETQISLAWLGFFDGHSGIHHYEVSVGSNYMDSDLNEGTDKHITMDHQESTGHFDESGTIQIGHIETKPLSAYQHVYLSLWAVNGVGLSSSIAHSQFKLHPDGSMELIRRCVSYTCQGHCVCAAKDQKCPTTGATSCLNLTDSKSGELVIQDVLNISEEFQGSEDVTHIPVNTALAATWTLSSNAEVPKWYEWSVGLSRYSQPTGIFESTERVWHDAGRKTSWVFTTSAGEKLIEDQQYSFFIRAWYDSSTFADFKSPGVIIQTKPPTSTHLFGKKVKEVLQEKQGDVDFISDVDSLYADWNEKFVNTQDQIGSFRVYISTAPGGHGSYDFTTPFTPDQTRCSLADLTLTPGVRYYVNVVAVTHAGLQKVESSDGFVLDVDPPRTGVVYDGTGPMDLQFQNRTVISTFWHQFSDPTSGIQTYKWCVSTSLDIGRCNILPFTDVGLKLSATMNPVTSIDTGTSVVQELVAVNYAGLESPAVQSDGVIIDTTPPVAVNSNHLENLILNPSFETLDGAVELEDFRLLKACSASTVSGWMISTGTCLTLINATTDTVQDGHQFVIVRGSMFQIVANTAIGEIYRVQFYTSHLPFEQTAIASKEGFLDVNGERHLFMLYNKPQKHDQTSSDLTLSWHRHTYYFKMKADNAIISVGFQGTATGLAIDQVTLQKLAPSNSPSTNSVLLHSVVVHDWSSVHAAWNFVDQESGIKEYKWAIGTVKGGTQLQRFTSVGVRNFGFNSSLLLPHNTKIYVTVVATNGADLSTFGYSAAAVIDRTPPLLAVHDGPTKDADIDFQETSQIHANFNVEDPESGIESCQWSIALKSTNVIIQQLKDVDLSINVLSADLNMADVENQYVIVTLKCKNGAGLYSTVSSDGVHILPHAPAVDKVHLEILPSSETQYPVRHHYHGNSDQIRLKWTGFDAHSWIEEYLIAVESDTSHASVTVHGYSPGYSYATLQDMQLEDGDYIVTLTGIDRLGRPSSRTSINMTVLTTAPLINDEAQVTIDQNRNTGDIRVSWDGVFLYRYPLYYEVSVGRARGNVDVVQWQETTHTHITFRMTNENIAIFGENVHATVRAISYSGVYTTVDADGVILPLD